MRELFAETSAVIAKARLEMDEVTATPEAIGVAQHLESALWIARRLAEARAAGRLSLAEEEGGEVSIAEEGALSLRPKR